MDPIHQFEIKKFFVLGAEIAFTNSALYMLIAVAAIALLIIDGTSRRATVPGRLQAVAEIFYEFVAKVVGVAGDLPVPVHGACVRARFFDPAESPKRLR
jgi:F-type H+-transporting ATPase subunit a